MNSLKRTLYPLVDIVLRRYGRPAVRNKTNSGECIAKYEKNRLDDVHGALKDSKFHRHTWLSTLKYVEQDSQRYYEVSSWVYWPEGFGSEWQTHVYVIETDSVVRVYAHYEKSIFKPSDHQNAAFQEAGDPQNHVDFLP